MSYQQILLERILSKKSAQDALSGVQVYHNNFIENGIRALSITFPTVAYLLEEPTFRALSKDFLLTEIKASFDWADYGAGFADFILAHPQLNQMPFLSEVAELDWYRHRLQGSEDKVFDANSFTLLSEQDPGSLSFVTAPGFTIAKFFFPVLHLHALSTTPALQEEGEHRDKFMQELNSLIKFAIKSDSPRSILLWRPDFKVEMLSLSDIETQVFQQVITGDSIANIFSVIVEQGQDFSAWLSEQITQKRIYGVHSTNN